MFSRCSRPGDTTRPCEREQIEGRFEPDEAKCGDEITLHASTNSVPNGSRIDFLIHDSQSHRLVDTVTTEVQGSQVRNAMWVAQKEDDQWIEPHLYFNATTSEAVSRSSNNFAFYRYRDFRRHTVRHQIRATNNSSGQVYGWKQKFTMEFNERRLIIRVRIKLNNYLGTKGSVPEPSIGEPDESFQRNIKPQIESYLSNRHIIHRAECRRGSSCDCENTRKCCKFEVHIRINFVERGEHHIVNLYPGTFRANAKDWPRVVPDGSGGTRTPYEVYAHEVGHLLGWYDEYDISGTGAHGPTPPWQTNRPGALMCDSGRDIPRFYYDTFKNPFQEKVEETWELLPVG